MPERIKLFFRSSRFKIAVWYSTIFLLLEILFGATVYFYLYHKSNLNLDENLKAQATAILRIMEEKHIDLESFQPNLDYKSQDELIWDILYDAIVFNRRNTFIQISNQKKIIFKTANLKPDTFLFPTKNSRDTVFNFVNSDLSDHPIRVHLTKGRRYNVIVAYPTEQIVLMLNGLTEIYIIMAPLFLLVSIIGGAIISTKSLARIDSIIRKTEEITAQNLQEIIPGGEYNDEFGRLVNKMNEMIARIKNSVEYMNQFSLSAAHELKTPLTILLGEIEVALRSDKPKENYIEVLQSNYEETLRLIKIVDNLFFISKSDNSLISAEYEEVDLRSFLNFLIKSVKILGVERNISIELTEIPPVNIHCDRDLIKQALSNLIDNAFKYGEENSTVIISAEVLSDKIKISVSNRGVGIPKQEIDKIFDRFYRVDRSRTRKTGGVGLGLAVVKSIINLHHGIIEVNSVSNNFTTFSIILPLK